MDTIRWYINNDAPPPSTPLHMQNELFARARQQLEELGFDCTPPSAEGSVSASDADTDGEGQTHEVHGQPSWFMFILTVEPFDGDHENVIYIFDEGDYLQVNLVWDETLQDIIIRSDAEWDALFDAHIRNREADYIASRE